MTRFRDRFFTRPVARAITSPSGILAAGSGAAAGMLVAGPVGAVIGGVLAWTGRVAAAIPRNTPGPRVDPFTLSEPWRSHVRDAQAARAQFADALRRTRPGPTRDRLGEFGTRVDGALTDAWEIAKAGHELAAGRSRLDTARVQRELAVAREQLRVAAPEHRLTWERTAQALDAQLATTARLDDLLRSTDAQLRLLNAQLDETVAKVIELSVRGSASAEFGVLGTELDSITTEMEALRQALVVVDAPASTPASMPTGMTAPSPETQ